MKLIAKSIPYKSKMIHEKNNNNKAFNVNDTEIKKRKKREKKQAKKAQFV